MEEGRERGVGRGGQKKNACQQSPDGRDRSEGAANDLGSLRIGLTTALPCWEIDRIFDTNGLSEEELSAETYSRSFSCSRLQNCNSFTLISQRKVETSFYLNIWLVSKKERDLPLAESVVLRQELLTKRS